VCPTRLAAVVRDRLTPTRFKDRSCQASGNCHLRAATTGLELEKTALS
jgi:hypothetical protein